MAKDLLFICNPKAGKSHIHGEVLEIANRLTRLGYRVILRPTQFAGDAKQVLAQTGQDYRVVAVSGGDGTLSEAVNGLMALTPQQRPPLLYLPAGSTNDFATSLGISKNPLLAVQAAAGERSFLCDMGRMNDRYFAYVAAFGAFTDVAYDTPQWSKNALGYLAYLLEVLKRLPSLKGHNLAVSANGQVMDGEII